MAQFPNLIICGAPKSGTSSLFFWLTAHPEVCGSTKKETYFLHDKVVKHNKGLNIHENGIEAYPNCFPEAPNANIVVEATAPYIYQKTPLREIPKLPSKPKVVFILRNPAERVYSHFKFNKFRMNNMPKSMPFQAYVEARGEGLNMQDYIHHSEYVHFIQKYIEVLGKERVLVYLFEDMLANKKAFMIKVAQDIGIDSSFYEWFDFFKRNETVNIKNKALHQWGLKIEPYVPQVLQEKVFIPLYLKLNGGKVPPKTHAEKEEINKLKEYYRPYNEKLKSLFPSLSIEKWQE